MDSIVSRFFSDYIDNAALCIGTIQGGGRAFQDFDVINGVHIDHFAKISGSPCNAVDVSPDAINEYNNVGRAIDINGVCLVYLCVPAVVAEENAGDGTNCLRNIAVMFLCDLICSHDCYIRIRVDLLFRGTARSNYHLI